MPRPPQPNTAEIARARVGMPPPEQDDPGFFPYLSLTATSPEGRSIEVGSYRVDVAMGHAALDGYSAYDQQDGYETVAKSEVTLTRDDIGPIIRLHVPGDSTVTYSQPVLDAAAELFEKLGYEWEPDLLRVPASGKGSTQAVFVPGLFIARPPKGSMPDFGIAVRRSKVPIAAYYIKAAVELARVEALRRDDRQNGKGPLPVFGLRRKRKD